MYPKPILLWTSFIKSNLNLTEEIRKWGYKTANILGETKPEQRQATIDKFQNGDLDVVAVGQAVGSFGFTLTAAKTAIYFERTYDGNYFQSLKRIHRIGTTESPIVINMMSTTNRGGETIDHLVNSLLDYRLGMIHNLTTGMLQELI